MCTTHSLNNNHPPNRHDDIHNRKLISKKSMISHPNSLSRHTHYNPVRSNLTVLESLLLDLSIIMTMTVVERVDIKAHVATDASLALAHDPSVRVDDVVAVLRGLDELGVLFLEQGEVALRLPVPDAVGGEEEVHLLEGALVRFRVEGPDHGDGDGVAGGEDVEGPLLEGVEHDGAEEGLMGWSVIGDKLRVRIISRLTNQPLPTDHPTTPHALPLARTSNGKISAGYSQGTVSQVAPNVKVKMYTIATAAAPYLSAVPALLASRAFWPRREKTPTKAMEIPWPTDPQ